MQKVIASSSFLRTVAKMTVMTALLSLSVRSLDAAVVTTGDVSPADPATWFANTVTIGNTVDGSVLVNGEAWSQLKPS